MKKMNLLAVAVLLFQQVGASDSGSTAASTVAQDVADAPSTDTAGQTYTFTYVAPTGDLSTPFSFSVSASVPSSAPSLSDLAKGLQNLITSIPPSKLYVYNGAGKYVASLNNLSSLNSSWMPAASSQASTFFVSTASNLSVDQILTAAPQN